MIDLHMHTNVSDGKLSPSKLVDLAVASGLKAIAVTDHDSVDGIGNAIDSAKGRGVEVISGIEISCDETKVGFKEVHVLGLLLDYKHKGLVEFTKNAKKERVEQKKKIVENLQGLGFKISFEDVKARAKESFGRPHIARLLIEKYPEKFSSIGEVFNQYLAVGKPAYVDRENKCDIGQAISVIKDAGGISVLAHPGVFHKKDSLELIELFKNKGGQGVETYYPYHLICPSLKIDAEENAQLIKFYQREATKRGLLEAGGSDFHGGDRQTINAVKVPNTVLEKLRAYRT